MLPQSATPKARSLGMLAMRSAFNLAFAESWKTISSDKLKQSPMGERDSESTQKPDLLSMASFAAAASSRAAPSKADKRCLEVLTLPWVVSDASAGAPISEHH